jgi:hypothetical protein
LERKKSSFYNSSSVQYFIGRQQRNVEKSLLGSYACMALVIDGDGDADGDADADGVPILF